MIREIEFQQMDMLFMRVLPEVGLIFPVILLVMLIIQNLIGTTTVVDGMIVRLLHMFMVGIKFLRRRIIGLLLINRYVRRDYLQ
jgi:hypothetical protein